MNVKRKALGRGLSSLIPEAPKEIREGLMMLDTDSIEPNRVQPRSQFKDLEGLAVSIKENGIIQPVIVTEKDGIFQLVAGERRWKAAQMAGVSQIPAILRHVSDDRRLELALVENLQRQELNPVEEARAYHLLLTDLHLTQQEVARRVGKDRSTVANQLRILKLPDKVQDLVADGKLDAGHAKAILSLSRSEQQVSVAQQVVKDSLSVRETEELVRGLQGPSGKKLKPVPPRKRDPNVEAAEERLCRSLATKVRIREGKKKGTGRIEIDYFTEDELDRLFSRLVTAAS